MAPRCLRELIQRLRILANRMIRKALIAHIAGPRSRRRPWQLPDQWQLAAKLFELRQLFWRS
jgi:hypothetical protein